jgi:hypothetical protein
MGRRCHLHRKTDKETTDGGKQAEQAQGRPTDDQEVCVVSDSEGESKASANNENKNHTPLNQSAGTPSGMPKDDSSDVQCVGTSRQSSTTDGQDEGVKVGQGSPSGGCSSSSVTSNATRNNKDKVAADTENRGGSGISSTSSAGETPARTQQS